ncbi:MAG: bifunctional alpha,alpha-trehalose-phosphate synthase (UDP-forming)/trehalose-phosphatase [Candidatus Auribacterota bacterium]|jgi:trehalose 6-phosphate synthase/phosphatase|uniref:Alpha,alpha-trehalose-phosphate synthase n=1 Tax=Candidatus Auribacter fodinae TaxID=2093366 RepID=A0A3A4R4K4_9BACT|nr:MAG: bifunctional alpha,alpha-trehalose-phosphate synthase (UDP-forming)/trehalose-phosphatase [Candidatus Auribacter fodinae]
MSGVVVVSNRLPVSVRQEPNGPLSFLPSSGGLATGLASLPNAAENLWVGWPGVSSDSLSKAERREIIKHLADINCRPVFLSDDDMELYYYGFSNKTVWPLFHYFPMYTVYSHEYWEAYRKVNSLFCDELLKFVKPGSTIWVHDYQLMLLPQMIRERMPDVYIGFFLHIPFPSFEIFRLLPYRMEIIDGLLGADLLGFHTYDYVRHFFSSVCRIKGIEQTLGEMRVGNRLVKADTFPLGIDYEKFSTAPSMPEVEQELAQMQEEFQDNQVIISIDRLDYTKGILQRLEAYDLFLHRYPDFIGKVTLVILAVPSRVGVTEYQQLREHVERLVGRINGEYGSLDWVPVRYMFRAVSFEKLIALYNLADVALITPLRDGMNLIAKECIAANKSNNIVLVLSEMAGAASELSEAVIVNANNMGEIADSIKQALTMPDYERKERCVNMKRRLANYTVKRWANEFLNAMELLRHKQETMVSQKLSPSIRRKLLRQYEKAQNRLLLLDYDGTMVSFAGRPEKAGPDSELISILQQLTDDPQNEVVIISGRDRETLSSWLGKLNVSMIAEHGGWLRGKNSDQWHNLEPMKTDWKEVIRPLMETYVDRTPGAIIEEKDFALVWHCRNVSPELRHVRSQELRDAIFHLTTNLGIGVLEGNKVLEVKNLSVNKGQAAQLWLESKKWDFIFAVGDDTTDEFMFEALPGSAYSIRVGYQITKARFNIENVRDVRSLLNEMAKAGVPC